jgi:penicillin-binding protein 1A
VQRPSRLNPASDRPLLEKQANALILAMAAEGYDTDAGHDARERGERTWNLNPYLFRDMAMRFMVPRELRESGDNLVVGFTIDTEAQLYAEMAATNLLNLGREAGYDSSAIIVMEPDGAIAALAIGHDYDGVDVVRNGRVSPGSTLKPFMYLCALEQGMRPEDSVDDRPRAWPSNFSGANYGAVTLEFALINSLNTIAVQLYERFGPECFADALGRAGIKLESPRQPTAVLGSEHVSLLSLASAYAALANGGYAVEPYAFRYARAQTGRKVYGHRTVPEASRITDERSYCDLMRMLRNVTSSKGTGRAAALDRPVWGKTGTSAGHRDALFAGFTGRYVAVVWLGRQARGDVKGRITGGELPAETFRWLIATLEAGKDPVPLDCRGAVKMAARAGARG